MSGELMRRGKASSTGEGFHSADIKLTNLQIISSYNERLKAYRKLFHQAFNANAIQKYWELLQSQARTLVANINRSPDTMLEQVKRSAIS